MFTFAMTKILILPTLWVTISVASGLRVRTRDGSLDVHIASPVISNFLGKNAVLVACPSQEASA